MGFVLLFALRVAGAASAEPVGTEQPAGLMEEVFVYGDKPLIELKRELIEAEDALYDLFNDINLDDDLDVVCFREAPIGSHIKRRVCRTQGYMELMRRASQRMLSGETYVHPAAEIKHLEKRLLETMTETALAQPEMLEALTKATAAQKALESERDRRCEDNMLFCW